MDNLKDNFFRKPRLWVTIVFLSALTLAMFWDVLFTANPAVLSRIDTDLFHFFIHLRNFAFTQLREGNLALWNPYSFSGLPCLGAFQSAQLYPLNLIYLLPSLAHAIKKAFS